MGFFDLLRFFCYFQTLTLLNGKSSLFPKEVISDQQSTNISETFSSKMKSVLLTQLVCASGLSFQLLLGWSFIVRFNFLPEFFFLPVLLLVRDCWLVNSVQFLPPTTSTENSHAVLLCCHWNMIWLPGASLLCLPYSTLHSKWIRIKAAHLLTPITMQKQYGIDRKRICLS